MLLVVAENAALAQHGVHQRGLAVVDVRNDGDIARVVRLCSLRFAMIGKRRLRTSGCISDTSLSVATLKTL